MSAHAGLWWRLQLSFFFSSLTCSKVKLITEILQKDVVYRIFRSGVSRQNATKKVAGSWKRLETLECALKKYMYHIYIEREREIDIGCRNHICSEGMWMCHFRCRFSLKSAFCTLRQVFPKWRNTKDVTAPTNVSPNAMCRANHNYCTSKILHSQTILGRGCPSPWPTGIVWGHMIRHVDSIWWPFHDLQVPTNSSLLHLPFSFLKAAERIWRIRNSAIDMKL